LPKLRSLVQVRRMVGLFAFFYGVGHGLHYFARDVGWDWLIISEDLAYRRFFIAGAIALFLMIPLAATSFTAAIRWMGGKRWQLLHRLIYPSAIAAVIHYLWQAKGISPTPLYYAGVLAILLAIRVVFFGQKKLRRAR
jgi:sulfoxide reductase heme-binding subunit YedZ